MALDKDRVQDPDEEILTILGALSDGAASEEERLRANAALDSSDTLLRYAAFLRLLKEAGDAAPRVAPSPELFARVAAETFARPSLLARLTAALRPSPARAALGGLALCGLAAIAYFAFRSATAPVPGPGGTQVAVNDAPTPEPVLATPLPQPSAAPTPRPQETPIPATPEPVATPAPRIELPPPAPIATEPPVLEQAATPAPVQPVQPVQPARAVRPAPASPKPAATPGTKPSPKPSPLPPARLAEPRDSGPMVAVEPGPDMALSTGDIRTPEESSGVVAQPQSAGAVAAATTRAAAQGEPTSLKIDMSRLIAGRTSAAVTLGVDKSAVPERSARIPIVTNSAQN